jgi:UDP-2-acetamido-2-deoxy-ribo-hexuluronate aminotransferase
MHFIDLKTQQERIRPQIDAAIKRVLDHGKYIMGPEVYELEEKLAEFVGSKHCISCSSGTDALLMALMAYGVGPGDAIFTTPFTFIATAEVISLLGATPVFVDIDPDTYNIDPNQLEQAIQAVKANDPSIHPLPSTPDSELSTDKNSSLSTLHSKPLTPRGLSPVDLFGLPADYDAIMPIAEKHDLFVLQDSAQAFGAEYKGKKCPSHGHIGATSFFPAKPLGCYGDGGAIFTDDDNLADIMRSIRVHGQGTDKYNNVRIGINGRMDTIQAAILLEKLKIYPEEIQLRQKVAERYRSLFEDRGLRIGGGEMRIEDRVPSPESRTPNPELRIPKPDPRVSKSVHAQFCLESDRRAAVLGKLKEQGIPTAIYYPRPVHLLEAYLSLGYEEGCFPVAEKVSERIFALPMHPYLTENEQMLIIESMQVDK